MQLVKVDLKSTVIGIAIFSLFLVGVCAPEQYTKLRECILSVVILTMVYKMKKNELSKIQKGVFLCLDILGIGCVLYEVVKLFC